MLMIVFQVITVAVISLVLYITTNYTRELEDPKRLAREAKIRTQETIEKQKKAELISRQKSVEEIYKKALKDIKNASTKHGWYELLFRVDYPKAGDLKVVASLLNSKGFKTRLEKGSNILHISWK